MSIIKAKDITTRFGVKLIHDKISFEIEENEIFGVLGGSGSGKSVILKQMLMLEHFDGGEYEILGKKLRKINSKDALSLRQAWGVVFQFGALFSFFTVYENVAMPLREYTHLSEHSIKELVFMKLKMAGLDESVRAFVAEFGHIIYISCNPQSLKRDLSALLKTHEILHFALFDQFATTAHLECGVILGKI